MATKLNSTAIPSGVDVANAIRNSASPSYRAAVPIADTANIQDVANPILTYNSIQNEFLNALVNKIALTIVNTKMFNNPLGFLKSGSSPLGLDIEEIYTNPAKAKPYDGENFQGILTPEKPDTKAAYYRRNRQDMYKVTISNEQLTAAFTSWNGLERLIASIVDTLYNGNTIGEFNLTKAIVGQAVSQGKVQQIVNPIPVDEPTSSSFLTSLRGVSSGMSFPSSKYTNYTLMGGTGDPVISWTDVGEQLIMVRSDVAANVDVQKLSAVFNLSYADYSAQQIIVDEFTGAPNMYALVCDRAFFKIWENLRRMTEFYNGEVLAWTYWWHCWDTYALSPFANAVAYVTAKYEPVGP